LQICKYLLFFIHLSNKIIATKYSGPQAATLWFFFISLIFMNSSTLPTLPAAIEPALRLAHTSWQATLRQGLAAMMQENPNYLPQLLGEPYLPTENRLFAAFAQPLDQVRYVLVGEGPYPRATSATGVCFMDGAVGSLWSDEVDGGLSKAVNRATSLRNFMKMLAVAAGELELTQTTGPAMAALARRARANPAQWIQTLAQLQQNLTHSGFLLLNASLVFRENVAPKIDAKAWQPFLEQVLSALPRPAGSPGAASKVNTPCLVLWGKIAGQLQPLPQVAGLPQIVAEHPYNLSFIGNTQMHALFAPMQLLRVANGRD
jgi:uracil-DNA glycosylase